MYYFIITPIGIIARIIGKDFIGIKKSNQNSYWNHRNSDYELNQDYEKQF